jgi:hypothetical protein
MLCDFSIHGVMKFYFRNTTLLFLINYSLLVISSFSPRFSLKKSCVKNLAKNTKKISVDKFIPLSLFSHLDLHSNSDTSINKKRKQ